MSTNTLETSYTNGQVIDASHVNELTLALLAEFIGRDTNGVPAVGQSLGTLAIPWGNLFCQGIVINGAALDVSGIVSAANRIVSGATRSTSGQPDFLRADGAAASFDLLATSTNLVLSINNNAATFTADKTKTGLTTAPASNNTCLVNDTSMTNDKYAGEDGTVITIDTLGSEVTALIGQIVAFEAPTGEYMIGLLKSATEYVNVFRGYFLDSAGSPVARGNLSNNDTLTLLKLGWVFAEDDGNTIDVSYTTPVVSYDSPSGPSTGDYWFDISNQVWKRYSGTAWEVIDRILVGVVALDDTNCVASRSFDFSNAYNDLNTVELVIQSTEIVETKNSFNRISVYGRDLILDWMQATWNITTDLATGLTEASNTVYYLYITQDGQRIIDEIKPYYRPDLGGDYHPYNNWRCLGMGYNDSSSDITLKWDYNTDELYRSNSSSTFSSSATSYTPITNLDFDFLSRFPRQIELRMEVVDAGSAGNDGIGCTGGSTTSPFGVRVEQQLNAVQTLEKNVWMDGGVAGAMVDSFRFGTDFVSRPTCKHGLNNALANGLKFGTSSSFQVYGYRLISKIPKGAQ